MKFLYCLLLAFPVLGQDPPRLKTAGGLQLRGIYYNTDAQVARRAPYTYVLSGNHTFSTYGLVLPFSYSLSNQGSNFQQPFNRFGLSPTYRWLTVHAGYRNLNFSPYTLDGQTLLGAGVELRPGRFRLGIVHGRVNKATAVDSSTGQTWAEAFHRTAWAGYLGYETEKLALTLSYLQAKDRPSKDSTTNRPAANTALGAGVRWRLLPQLTVEGDAGLSLYTRDRLSPLHVQASAKKIYEILDLNATSELYLAYTAALRYQTKNWGLDLLWKYVDPNFESMGVYFFQNDIKSLSIAPKLQLFNGKLRLDANLGLQEDNVLKQKEARTRRIISFTSIRYEMNSKLSFDGNYSNYSSNSQPKVALIQNKYLLAQTNTNYSLNPRWVLPGNKVNQLILLSFNGAELKDLSPEGQNIQTQTSLLSYHYIHQAFSVFGGINYNINRIQNSKVKNYGWQAGANTALIKKSLNLGINYTWSRSDGLQGKGNVRTAHLTASYQLAKKQHVQLRINTLNNGIAEAYKEINAEIAYALNF